MSSIDDIVAALSAGLACPGDRLDGAALAEAIRKIARSGASYKIRLFGGPEGLDIDGDLDLSGLEGNLALIAEQCRFSGNVDLSSARIDWLRFELCSMAEADFHQIRTEGLLSLNTCHIRKAVNLSNARIDGVLALESSRIDGDRKKAARIGLLHGEDEDLFYALDARHAVINGGVHLMSATLDADSAPFRARGKVSFRNARVRGHLSLQGAEIEQPQGRIALDLNGARVDKSVYLNIGFRASGMADLRGLSVGGQLNCRRGVFRACDPDAKPSQGATMRTAIFANGAAVQRQLILVDADIDGDVVLTGAHVGELWDAEGEAAQTAAWIWPKRGDLYLDGFVYERINRSSAVSPKYRIAWLKRQAEEDLTRFKAQPWTQLGMILLRTGHDEAARKIFRAREKLRSRRAGFWRRLLSGVFDATVGFGYSPLRGVAWLMALILAGAVIYADARERDMMRPSDGYTLFNIARREAPGPAQLPSGWSCLDPIAYSLDVALPLVDLGQERYWLPSPEAVPIACDSDIWSERFQPLIAFPAERIGAIMRAMPPVPTHPVLTEFTRAFDPLLLWFWFQKLAGAILLGLTGLAFSGVLKREGR